MDKRRTVLFIDDEYLLVYAVSEFLSREGFEVKATTSSEEALSMIEREHFDVVVTDLRMVPVSGIDIIKHLRSAGFKGKIIVVSAYFKEFEKDLQELNVDSLLDKPFELSRLLQMIGP